MSGFTLLRPEYLDTVTTSGAEGRNPASEDLLDHAIIETSYQESAI